jgi:hypothetical protein
MVIALSILIVGLFILCYKTIHDIHESVVIALRWNPDAKISRVSRLAYNFIESRK